MEIEVWEAGLTGHPRRRSYGEVLYDAILAGQRVVRDYMGLI